MDEKDDRLNFENNATIKKIIGEEKIIFSDKITKINVDKVLNKSQERNILITNLAIYNIKGDEKKRRIRIDELQGITISKLSHQFIIHCIKMNMTIYSFLNLEKKLLKYCKLYSKLRHVKIYYSVKKMIKNQRNIQSAKRKEEKVLIYLKLNNLN